MHLLTLSYFQSCFLRWRCHELHSKYDKNFVLIPLHLWKFWMNSWRLYLWSIYDIVNLINVLFIRYYLEIIFSIFLLYIMWNVTTSYRIAGTAKLFSQLSTCDVIIFQNIDNQAQYWLNINVVSLNIWPEGVLHSTVSMIKALF